MNILLDHELFFETIGNLVDDPSYLVKVQLLEIVNSLLWDHPKHKNIMELWVDVVCGLIIDNDNKIIELAIKSILKIFEKIESFENTITEQEKLPWKIISLIQSKGKRRLLQSAIGSATLNLLSPNKSMMLCRKIETHILSHRSVGKHKFTNFLSQYNNSS